VLLPWNTKLVLVDLLLTKRVLFNRILHLDCTFVDRVVRCGGGGWCFCLPPSSSWWWKATPQTLLERIPIAFALPRVPRPQSEKWCCCGASYLVHLSASALHLQLLRLRLVQSALPLAAISRPLCPGLPSPVLCSCVPLLALPALPPLANLPASRPPAKSPPERVAQSRRHH
jgi:hypothetical protein